MIHTSTKYFPVGKKGRFGKPIFFKSVDVSRSRGSRFVVLKQRRHRNKVHVFTNAFFVILLSSTLNNVERILVTMHVAALTSRALVPRGAPLNYKVSTSSDERRVYILTRLNIIAVVLITWHSYLETHNRS